MRLLRNPAAAMTSITIAGTLWVPGLSPNLGLSKRDVVTGSSQYIFATYKGRISAVTSAKPKEDTDKEKFLKLTAKWKQETKVKSILEPVILNPSYQQIIGMGEIALPFIFQDLKDSKSYWAHALFAITEADPTPPNANKAQVREAWLKWGADRGYVSS